MAKQLPTHEVFGVTDRGRGKKAFWHKIGAAWAHEDGKGFALRLDYLPLNGQEIVIREPLPEKDVNAEKSDTPNTGSADQDGSESSDEANTDATDSDDDFPA